ncbi:cryptochrome/photolyase family protein, partial [filamentous cyanobacterium CCP1]
MTIGIWILGDQLWMEQTALQSCVAQRQETPIILIESARHGQERPYHRQKLVLVWSAMRHFAEELRQAGWAVTYEIAEDFETPLQNWIQAEGVSELRVMSPNDRPFSRYIQSLDLPCEIKLVPNNHFLWTADE